MRGSRHFVVFFCRQSECSFIVFSFFLKIKKKESFLQANVLKVKNNLERSMKSGGKLFGNTHA